jgi:hypothetical protein
MNTSGKIQYEKAESFELDVNLKPKDFLVKQDEVIAYSGATGGAEGPHLHFEIRDEANRRTNESISCLDCMHSMDWHRN